MAKLAFEQFRTLYFADGGSRVLDERIWVGNATGVEVPLHQIIRQAIALDAGFLVVAHNHPSGDPRPSKQDVELTRKLFGICKEMQIRVHDHLIVAHDQSYSFREQGLL